MTIDQPPLSHRELQELLGVYALDAVEPELALVIEDHLRGCAKCAQEVAEHHEVAGLLANSGGTAPTELWQHIAGRLGETEPPSWEQLAGRLDVNDEKVAQSERPTSGHVEGAAASTAAPSPGPSRSRTRP